MNLLLVHDDENVRGALSLMLGRGEHNLVASSTANALPIAQRFGAKVVIVDITLDALKLESTLGLLREFKRQALTTVVVALVPKMLPVEVTRQITGAAGLVRWLKRPFLQLDLHKAVQDAGAIALLCQKMVAAGRNYVDLADNPLQAVTGA